MFAGVRRVVNKGPEIDFLSIALGNKGREDFSPALWHNTSLTVISFLSVFSKGV